MNIFGIPDPVSIVESAVTAGFERDEIKAIASSAYSAQITFCWRLGATLSWWKALGRALMDMATAQYLALQPAVESKKLTLTVPQDLLENLSHFQTETKK